MPSRLPLPQLLLAITLVASANAWLPSGTTKHPLSRVEQSSRVLDGVTTAPPFTTSDEDEFSTPLEEFSMDRVGLSPNLPQRTVDAWTNPREFTPFQQFARVSPLVTMGAYAVNPAPLDSAVENFYHWMISLDVTQTHLFEAHVAVFSFFGAILFFSVLHLVLDEETVKKYHLDGQMPQENPLSWATKEEFQLWFNPVVAYLGSILIYQQVFQTYKPPPILAPTFGVLVAEVAFGVFLYDLCFAPVHLFMHKGPLKEMRSVHGYHHRHSNGSLNPVETVQHSYVDGTLQVMVNIFVQHISPFGGPKHVLSRIIHNVLVTYMLSESHSGYNFSWMTHNIWPEFLGGSPRHERHHKDGRVYYQQFFTYLDDALGYTDQDVAENLQHKKARAAAAAVAMAAASTEEEEEEGAETSVRTQEEVQLTM